MYLKKSQAPSDRLCASFNQEYFKSAIAFLLFKCEMHNMISVESYLLPVPAQLPRCPGYAERTWHGSAQRVADSHPTGESAALTHSSSLLEGLGLQSSRGSYLYLHHPTSSLPPSAATPTAQQPADTSLQPAGRQPLLFLRLKVFKLGIIQTFVPKSSSFFVNEAHRKKSPIHKDQR